MSLEMVTWALDARLSGTMSDGERVVLLQLADVASADGTGAFLSVRTIAAKAGMNERTVKRWMKKLRERGVITPGDQRRAAYIPAASRPVVYNLVTGAVAARIREDQIAEAARREARAQRRIAPARPARADAVVVDDSGWSETGDDHAGTDPGARMDTPELSTAVHGLTPPNESEEGDSSCTEHTDRHPGGDISCTEPCTDCHPNQLPNPSKQPLSLYGDHSAREPRTPEPVDNSGSALGQSEPRNPTTETEPETQSPRPASTSAATGRELCRQETAKARADRTAYLPGNVGTTGHTGPRR